VITIFTRRFRKIYFILMAVAAFGIVCWFMFLWLRLDTYEKSMPENMAARVFEQHFSELAFDKLYEWEKPFLSELETLEHYTAYMSEKVGNGERSYRILPESTETLKKYMVLAGNDIFAEFELEQRSGLFGLIWELAGIATISERIETFNIVVPVGRAAFVNGKQVSDSYKTADGIDSPLMGRYDTYTVSNLIARPEVGVRFGDGVKPLAFDSEANEYSAIPVVRADILDNFTLFINNVPIDESFLIAEDIRTDETDRLRIARKIYKVNCAFEDPDILVINTAGTAFHLKEAGTGNYIQEIIYDIDLETKFRNFAVDAAKTYAMYMTNNSSLAELRKYFETGTQTYDNIRTSEVYWYTDHIGYWFENEEAMEFFEQDAGHFSCRVTLDQYVQRTARDLHHFPLDVTFFIRDNNGQYLIYDMKSNA